MRTPRTHLKERQAVVGINDGFKRQAREFFRKRNLQANPLQCSGSVERSNTIQDVGDCVLHALLVPSSLPLSLLPKPEGAMESPKIRIESHATYSKNTVRWSSFVMDDVEWLPISSGKVDELEFDEKDDNHSSTNSKVSVPEQRTSCRNRRAVVHSDSVKWDWIAFDDTLSTQQDESDSFRISSGAS